MSHLTENQVFNLVSGSAATGQSTYDMWKTIEGNEDKSVEDFLNYLKDDGESNVSEEVLVQIEQNKNDISQLSETISDKQPKGDYALKSEIPNVPVQSVNGKTGAVILNAVDVGATTQEYVDGEIADVKAQMIQQTPLFANSIDECTDTTKVYLLPDGYIYAYMKIVQDGGLPLFTNLAKPSNDDWKANSRINASGSIASSSESGAFVSNIFECKSGDILRVKNVSGTSSGSSTGAYFKFFPLKSDGSNFNNNGGFYLINCPTTVELGERLVGDIVNITQDGVYEYTILLNSKNEQSYNSANVAKGRVAGLAINGAENVIITINEEIKYSESTEMYTWVSTGRQFVPSDYEDDILALQHENEQLNENLEIVKMKTEESLTYDKLFNPIIFKPEWEIGTFAQTIGGIDSNVSNNIRQRMPSKVTLPYDIKIESDGVYKYLVAFYNASGNVASTKYYRTEELYIPKNTAFRIIIADAIDDSKDISAITSNEINTNIIISETTLNGLLNSSINWIAMGDSITEGYVSYLNGTKAESHVDIEKSWAHKVSIKNNWKLTNIGIGGSGYIDLENTDNDGVTSAWYIAKNTDFTPYNLVTLAYGVNDWKGNIPLGTINDTTETPTTIYGGMKATIESIIESNPFCKIVVITPLNCVGYNKDYGTEETNWALSKAFPNNGTLEDVFEAIVEVCEYYGIEYIDMTHKSVINRKNILECLTDGIHPNEETHTLLANELAKKIQVI